MKRETSIDIDTIEDIKVAEYYLGVEKMKKNQKYILKGEVWRS